ncbi:MAG: radical SAM protein [Candidatus Moraniibacteriota bacterium]
MKKIYPLKNSASVVGKNGKLTVKINPSLEGLTVTPEMLAEKTEDGLKKLLSLEFCWLPSDVVETYNKAQTVEKQKEILIDKVWGNCKLNCKGCFAKQPDIFKGHPLVTPEVILDLIEESVNNLGTKTVKYLGPSEFFRDKDVFKHLDRFKAMGVICGIFVKDPMFGSDKEVETLFGEQGIHTADELVKKLASYENLRILFNFRSFEEEKTNYLVSGGYDGKEDYVGNYKEVQTKALQLLYKYFAEEEFKKDKEARLSIINAPITPETVDEAIEIFKYFTDKGLSVVSTTSMQSGCGGGIYKGLDNQFMEKFEKYYAETIKHSVKRGLITSEYLNEFGPSPYAGINHCIQLCNGILIRETGLLFRCPGADHSDWQDEITPEKLLKNGIVWAWKKTKNYAENSKVNVGCLAKPKIFTKEFNDKVLNLYHS